MLIALLVGEGHNQAWNYGYSFFKTALKSLQIKQLQAIQTLASGINQAFSDDGGKKLQANIDKLLAGEEIEG